MNPSRSSLRRPPTLPPAPSGWSSWLSLGGFRCRVGFILLQLPVGAWGQATYTPYRFTTLAGKYDSAGSANDSGGPVRFGNPAGMAMDSAGNLYNADAGNAVIRKMTFSPCGLMVTNLAGLAGNPGSDDGVGAAARFLDPRGVAVDSAGNVFVADSGNDTIRKITPGGTVTTIAGLAGTTSDSTDGHGSAARFFYPYGVAVDAGGTLYVADSWNSTIRKISPAGDVTTLAGLARTRGTADGPGAAARFFEPYSLVVDAAGNVYVADSNNYTIRKITPAGIVSTIAGQAGVGRGSADGPGAAARFALTAGLALDAAGNLDVTDINGTVRKLTFLQGAVTVTTVAGQPAPPGRRTRMARAARLSFISRMASRSIRRAMPM